MMLCSLVTSRIIPLHIVPHPQIPETFRTLPPRNPNQISIFHTLAFRGSATPSDSTTSPLFRKQPGGIPLRPLLEPTLLRSDKRCGIFSALFHFPEAFPK